MGSAKTNGPTDVREIPIFRVNQVFQVWIGSPDSPEIMEATSNTNFIELS